MNILDLCKNLPGMTINCETSDEADLLLATLHGLGCKWGSGSSLCGTYWHFEKDNTCYYIDKNKRVTFSDKGPHSWMGINLHDPMIKFSQLKLQVDGEVNDLLVLQLIPQFIQQGGVVTTTKDPISIANDDLTSINIDVDECILDKIHKILLLKKWKMKDAYEILLKYSDLTEEDISL